MKNLRFHGFALIAGALTAALVLSIPSVESTHPPFSCDPSDPSTKSYIFCRTALPILRRVEDLVSRMTLDEKISQLVNTAAAIPRLGVPAYQWWSEALHGVSNSGLGIDLSAGEIRSATSFPQVILTAASFDARLWYAIGQAIGKEARAVYNGGQAKGMTFWAPNINIFRDPRWGRGQETPGEDPMVTANYAVSYVRGIQGDAYGGGQLESNGGQLMASACCKHFTAYDLDKWTHVNRFGFNAQVSKQDLADTYQPPFKSCIHEGRASGIMCAYNRVNGVPNCADYNLLTTTARGLWAFDGYITSDCDVVSIIHDNYKYANSPEDAVADVLKAGMDVNCGSYLKNYTKSAIQHKKLIESDIDRALHNLFSVRMRLGLFNGNPSQQPLGKIGLNHVCSQEHQDLALEAARNGIVLLKNSARLLPLPKTRSLSLAIIGPNANTAKTFLGNYAGPPCQSVTILEALHRRVNNIIYNQGCASVSCTYPDTDKAVSVAKQVDYVVLVMGLDQSQEREDLDRMDLLLPGKQKNLMESVAKASKKPVILVLLCGGPVDISFAKYNPKIGGILWAGYPGQGGGLALAEIIFGDHNPGGRLPVTWYPADFVRVPMTDMRMREDPSSKYPGRTYRFYKGRKVFEFGYGLSYTTYSYNFVSVNNHNELKLSQFITNVGVVQTLDSTRFLRVSEMETKFCHRARFLAIVGVENIGGMAGKHPVLLFVRKSRLGNKSPLKQLIGFQSVALTAGQRDEIEFVINPCEHLSESDEDGLMMIEDGERYLVVGDKEYPINVVI